MHRVALVASSFTPHIGGVETHVARVAAGLRDRGHSVEVWTVDRGEGVGLRDVEGITVRAMAAPLPSGSIGGIWRFLVALPGAWRMWVIAYRSFGPTLLHVHCFGPNGAYAFALHRRFRTPLWVTSHGETFMDDSQLFDTSFVLRKSLKAALARAAIVTGPSQAVLADLTRRFSLRGGVVVPNGVDLGVHPRPSPIPGKYIFAVGRLGRTKGFDLLLDAFAEARLPGSVGLVIGGDGPERAALEQRARQLGIAHHVEFLGWLDEQSIADAMGGSLAVAVPSRVEAFGIVALEAWRAGAPLLMTRHGGATEFMRDGIDALLIDPMDSRSSSDAMRRLFADPALCARLAASGRERVREFSWSGVIDRYESMLLASPTPR